jgi:hypothetical protein
MLGTLVDEDKAGASCRFIVLRGGGGGGGAKEKPRERRNGGNLEAVGLGPSTN